eukprot:CAMPEP_0174922258 /NCGR_PEP_ID=MMETSP1355-20121228/5744_1 /TAXON_ID=464990 /ORGANISM="Hemiselmis tepida, Strain CCMP443" /LENGTH=114 /DNA_ID=CAMNT_0016167831 /DNA_START=271 /DNA_END=617 /DNA_ORIENTATION=+
MRRRSQCRPPPPAGAAPSVPSSSLLGASLHHLPARHLQPVEPRAQAPGNGNAVCGTILLAFSHEMGTAVAVGTLGPAPGLVSGLHTPLLSPLLSLPSAAAVSADEAREKSAGAQ